MRGVMLSRLQFGFLLMRNGHLTPPGAVCSKRPLLLLNSKTGGSDGPMMIPEARCSSLLFLRQKCKTGRRVQKGVSCSTLPKKRVTRRVQKQQQDIEVPRCAALLLAVAHMARAYNLGNEEKTELKSAIMDRTQSSSVYTALDSYERHGSHERFLHNLSEIAEHKLRMKHQEAETKQFLDAATLPPAWWYEDQTARVWLASWYECAGAEKEALSTAGSDADDEEEAEDTMSDSSEDMQDMPHLHVSIPRPGVEQTIQIANAKGGFEEYSPQGVADFDQWMCNTPVTTHRVKDRSMSFLEI